MTSNVCRETNAALLARVQAGEATAVNELIENNLGLVPIIVKEYVVEYDRMRGHFDDLIGVGRMAVVSVVNELLGSSRPIGKVGAVLSTAIKRALQKYTDEHTGCGPKHSTKKKVRASTGSSPGPLEVQSDTETFEAGVGLFRGAGDHLTPLRDLILSCCHDDLDREIVDGRECGFTDAEIAVKVGKSSATIHRRREEIKRRYYEAVHALCT